MPATQEEGRTQRSLANAEGNAAQPGNRRRRTQRSLESRRPRLRNARKGERSAARRAGVSPAKRQAVVISSASFCGGGDAGETLVDGNFCDWLGCIAQPGNRRRRFAPQRAQASRLRNDRKGEHCAAWRAGVSPAKRSATVIFATHLAIEITTACTTIAGETPAFSALQSA